MPKILFRPAFLRACFLLAACALPAVAKASLVEADIQKLYVGCFGRPADPTTVAYYIAQTAPYGSNDGAALDALAVAFTQSTEFVTLMAGKSTADKVAAIIQAHFSRSPSVPEGQFWTFQLDSAAISVDQLVRSLETSATGADLDALTEKGLAASAFAAALSPSDRIAYSSAGPFAVARAYLARVSDAASYAIETDPSALNATIQQMVQAGQTLTQTFTQSPTLTATQTPSVSSTFSSTLSRTPIPLASATATSTATPSPSVTRTPTETLTLTAVGSPAAATATPEPSTGSVEWGVEGSQAPVALGPVPAKRGQALCLGSRHAVSSSRWIVYNAASPPQVVATLDAASGGCLGTSALAPGLYYVDCATEFSDRSGDRRMIKIVIEP